MLNPRQIFHPFFAGFKPRKQLGQNFLADPNIVRKILAHCSLQSDDIVLEIGPGLGVLTSQIAPYVKSLIAIETDGRFYEALKNKMTDSNVNFIHADFLKYDFNLLPIEKIKVIGNLPYYISSAILIRTLTERRHFSSLFITVQWEFARRLAAKADTKEYGALSCFVQYFSSVELLFKIKNTCFSPVPKVDSCFVRLDIFEEPPYRASNEEFLFMIIRQAFQQRRKTIARALLPLIPKEELLPILESLKLSPQLRAENLKVKDFVALANQIKA